MKTRRGLPKKLRVYIDRFLATGETIENIRDIWYNVKGDIEHLNNKGSDKAWDDYVNGIIGEHLYEDIFLQGDTGIYNRLEVISKGLGNTGYTFNTPLVLFVEKTTRAIENATKSLLCGRYDSTGQIPSFEAVKIAEYLAETSINNEAYIVGFTDYDPAGESIFNSLINKVKESLEVMDSLIEVVAISIKYGSDYDEIIGRYDTFTLSKDPKNHVNQAWIKNGRTLGVEMNVVRDKRERIEDAILSQVSPSIVKALSKSRAIDYEFNLRLSSSQEHKAAEKLVKQIEDDISNDVNEMEVEFSNEWTDIDFTSIRKMTTLS